MRPGFGKSIHGDTSPAWRGGGTVCCSLEKSICGTLPTELARHCQCRVGDVFVIKQTSGASKPETTEMNYDSDMRFRQRLSNGWLYSKISICVNNFFSVTLVDHSSVYYLLFGKACSSEPDLGISTIFGGYLIRN
jgi:hypothetical protein